MEQGIRTEKKGEDIPLFARIIAIADTFDAMTSDRPYQNRMDPDFVVDKISSWAESRYDPRIVKAFLQVYQSNLDFFRESTDLQSMELQDVLKESK